MCRCPLLALSATIGNPRTFARWLRRVKALQFAQDQANAACSSLPGTISSSMGSTNTGVAMQQGQQKQALTQGASASGSPKLEAGHGLPGPYQVHLITHGERFNDIKYQLYCPPVLPDGGVLPGSTAQLLGSAREQLLAPMLSAPSAQTSAASAAAASAAVGTGTGAGSGRVGSSSSMGGSLLGNSAPMHPIASLDLPAIASGAAGGMDSLSLAPDEALSLYDAMLAEAKRGWEGLGKGAAGAGGCDDGESQQQQRALLQALEGMDPSESLAPRVLGGGAPGGEGRTLSSSTSRSSCLLTRPAAKAWASAIISQIVAWCRGSPFSLSAMQRVQARLVAPAQQGLAGYEDAWWGAGEAAAGDSPHARPAQLAHFLPLVHSLRLQGLLPALVFNFDRRQVGCGAGCCRRILIYCVTSILHALRMQPEL